MNWGWLDTEADDRPTPTLEELGLRPRAPRFGEIRWIGQYEVPLYEDVFIEEFIVQKPWWMVPLQEWWPYQPPGFSAEHFVGLADFYLSRDGAELIGSHLQPPPIEPTTRFALVVHLSAGLPNLLFDRKIKEPDVTPIPERLLRLIWLEC